MAAISPVIQPQSPASEVGMAAAFGMTAPMTAVMGGIANVSLYVGDLHSSVTENQLYEVFSVAGAVLSIRVCRDYTRRYSLGYAYVNFTNPKHAAKAMNDLNYTPINGKPIRIMFIHRDPSIRKSGHANVFIKNLDTSIDNKALHETFASFGNVLSCKVALDSLGNSKGYGFVQFERDEAAQEAINRLNGMLMNDKQVYVGLFVRRQERNGSPRFTNAYVKNLSESFTDEDLRKVFGELGTITSAIVVRDANGNSRLFGFVNFQNPECAVAAVEQLNETTHDEKVWYVGRAQRKADREAELKTKFEQEKISRYEKLQGANLYLKNLDDDINDEKLGELFAEFGTITSCKVMLDAQGQSKGSGFVAFSTPEEASKAMHGMNGKMLGRKPLYVAVAQRKEERKYRLMEQFSQIRGPAGMTPMHGFHPMAPRLAPQPIYYGQGTSSGMMMPPLPAGYYQQQLMPGVRPSVAPNYILPYHLQRQGQYGQQMGVRRGGNPHQQQQMMYRNLNQGMRYMAPNGQQPSMVPQGLVSPQMMPPQSFDFSAMPGPLTMSALASSTPDQQRGMLGEHLYPLVKNLEPEYVGKVTGMLLEMDQTEVLHLIESPDALKKKVTEAMDVLRSAKSGTD